MKWFYQFLVQIITFNTISFIHNLKISLAILDLIIQRIMLLTVVDQLITTNCQERERNKTFWSLPLPVKVPNHQPSVSTRRCQHSLMIRIPLYLENFISIALKTNQISEYTKLKFSKLMTSQSSH